MANGDKNKTAGAGAAKRPGETGPLEQNKLSAYDPGKNDPNNPTEGTRTNPNTGDGSKPANMQTPQVQTATPQNQDTRQGQDPDLTDDPDYRDEKEEEEGNESIYNTEPVDGVPPKYNLTDKARRKRDEKTKPYLVLGSNVILRGEKCDYMQEVMLTPEEAKSHREHGIPLQRVKMEDHDDGEPNVSA